MKCVVCKIGETAKGRTTVTLRRADTVVVIEGVDAHICSNCGHYYLDSSTAKKTMAILNEAIARGARLEILAPQAA